MSALPPKADMFRHQCLLSAISRHLFALMLESNAPTCAAEQQQYNGSPLLLVWGQSLVESLRRRLQCFHRVELRLHHVGLRMHAVDRRAYAFRGHLGLMRRL